MGRISVCLRVAPMAVIPLIIILIIAYNELVIPSATSPVNVKLVSLRETATPTKSAKPATSLRHTTPTKSAKPATWLRHKEDVPVVNKSASRQYNTTFPPTELKIPNVLHYVWFNDHRANTKLHSNMNLFRMIGPISAYKNLRPERIILHSNQRPSGRWWDELFRIVPMEYEHYPEVKRVFDKPIDHPAHRSDVARIDVIRSHGGIYLDMDVIVLKSFDPLRVHDCVLGVETGAVVKTRNVTNAGVILGVKNATFLNMWYDGYRDYRKNDWLYNSGFVPNKLRAKHENLVHIERNIWHDTTAHIFKGYVDFSETYAYHMWYKNFAKNVVPRGVNPKDLKPEDAFRIKSSFGELLLKFYVDEYWQGDKEVIPAS